MSFKHFSLSVCNSLLKKKRYIVNDEKEEAVKNTTLSLSSAQAARRVTFTIHKLFIS